MFKVLFALFFSKGHTVLFILFSGFCLVLFNLKCTYHFGRRAPQTHILHRENSAGSERAGRARADYCLLIEREKKKGSEECVTMTTHTHTHRNTHTRQDWSPMTSDESNESLSTLSPDWWA